ncbi:MAG: hypothetical protein Q8P41_08020 [Pseudomonadota bacterium]|nr:hypothetical protein [Pseudomonadota bacterium]
MSRVRSVLPLLLLVACGPGAAVGEAGIDVSGLWPATEGAFLAYRNRTPEQLADPEQADVLDEANLLLSRYEAGGCGDTRVALRVGGSWDSAIAVGALHLDTSGGVAICGHEGDDGTVEAYDPAVPLWVEGSPLEDAVPATHEGWSVTASREADLSTYFGVFPATVAFALSGDGALDGWVLHLADGFGLVLLETDTLAADLVYTR